MKNLLRFAISLVLVGALHLPVFSQATSDAALESIGSISAVALYNSYTTLGILADAYEHEAYESDYVIRLLDEQISLHDNMKTSYNKLLSSGFVTSADDKKFVLEAIATFDILKNEAEAFQSYVDTGDTKYSNQFQEYRKLAWERIADLLGID
ncbi:MAG: hypothetical protein JNK77_12595 [Saprospiraceae bacterium]|nr:hypothetical protein [Saprospiraceae bacterium]